MTRCIVSCAYSDDGRYVKYARRLEESLRAHGYKGAFKCWTESFPPESPTHRETHYAFKVYAVKWALSQGHTSIAWLDSACHAIADVEPLWTRIESEGHYIITGGDVLGEWISDQALAYFKVTRDEAMTLKLTGGCVVGLDFTKPVARAFYDQWMQLAQTKLFISAHSAYAPDKMKSLLVSDHDEKLIVSEDPRVKGHRSDEACFALQMRQHGMSDVKLGTWAQIFKTGYEWV